MIFLFADHNLADSTTYFMISLMICALVPPVGEFILPPRVRDYQLRQLIAFACTIAFSVVLSAQVFVRDPLVILSILLS
ncbi:hypothetical protein EDB19DRAFT_1691095 [Suillus lakei]|nr:hypothetical protein EDB19DRAFT_1691095 [Suillus lakei]